VVGEKNSAEGESGIRFLKGKISERIEQRPQRHKGCGANADRVCLTTLHGSKGLQFDVVIIPGLEEGRLPSYSATTDEAIREARRTFYVGFTRARHLVYLLYSGWYRFRRYVFENGPSRFVLELQKVLGSTEE